MCRTAGGLQLLTVNAAWHRCVGFFFSLKAMGSSVLHASYRSVQDLLAEQPCVGHIATL